MNDGARTIIYPVSNLDASKALFTTLLGVEPSADSPYYVGFDVGNQHIGLNPHAHGQEGPMPLFHVGDIRGTLQALIDGGSTLDADVRDVGNGRLIASVKDPDGSLIGLLEDPA